MVSDDATDCAALPTVDLASVTPSTFAPLIGHVFTVAATTPSLSLALTAVDALPSSAGPGRREPFALVFTGPGHPILAQGVFAIEHAALGRLDLFLVPIAPDAQGARYEAIFS